MLLLLSLILLATAIMTGVNISKHNYGWAAAIFINSLPLAVALGIRITEGL